MAILHFMTTLTREKSRQTVVKLCIIFNLITFIAAIFAVAFQCQLPQPWAILSDKCFDQVPSFRPSSSFAQNLKTNRETMENRNYSGTPSAPLTSSSIWQR